MSMETHGISRAKPGGEHEVGNYVGLAEKLLNQDESNCSLRAEKHWWGRG